MILSMDNNINICFPPISSVTISKTDVRDKKQRAAHTIFIALLSCLGKGIAKEYLNVPKGATIAIKEIKTAITPISEGE
jgi:hypothetical protein